MRENNLNKKRFRTKWLVCLLLLMLLTAAEQSECAGCSQRRVGYEAEENLLL